jgi:transcription antitermination factor NusG
LTLLVAQVYPRAEVVAERHLRSQGFGVEVLRRTVRKPERGVWVERQALVLPGYIFVMLTPDADRWQAINYTRGVRGLLPRRGERPLPLDEGVLACLRGLIFETDWIKIGQRLQIIAGSFNGLNVNCVNIDEKRQVLDVNVAIFGRDVMLRLGVNDVVPCTDEP